MPAAHVDEPQTARAEASEPAMAALAGCGAGSHEGRKRRFGRILLQCSWMVLPNLSKAICSGPRDRLASRFAHPSEWSPASR